MPFTVPLGVDSVAVGSRSGAASQGVESTVKDQASVDAAQLFTYRPRIVLTSDLTDHDVAAIVEEYQRVRASGHLLQSPHNGPSAPADCARGSSHAVLPARARHPCRL